MAQTDIDPHAKEKPASTTPQPETLNALRLLRQSLGAAGAGQFVALASAFEIVARGIVSAIRDSQKQSKTLATNKVALKSASLQVPTVQPPGLNDGIKTVSTSLQGIDTIDTAKLNQATAAASNTRDPNRLQDFKSDMIDQLADEANQDIRTLGDHLKTVQGMKEGVQST